MDIWTKTICFYAVAGCIIGLFVSGMDKVNAEFRGRPLPYPRLISGVTAGLLWPAIVVQMVWPRRGHQ